MMETATKTRCRILTPDERYYLDLLERERAEKKRYQQKVVSLTALANMFMGYPKDNAKILTGICRSCDGKGCQECGGRGFYVRIDATPHKIEG